MPFYNCFNYTLIQDILLTLDMKKLDEYNKETDPMKKLKLEQKGYEIGSDPNYKLVAIPIKFNKTYTIAIDCS